VHTKTVHLEQYKQSLLEELRKFSNNNNYLYSTNGKSFFTNRKFSIIEKYNSSDKNIVRSIFLSSMFQAEQKAPEVSNIFIPLYLDLYDSDKKIDIANISKLLRKLSYIPDRQWIKTYIQQSISDKTLYDMLLNALDFAGLYGKLSIDYTDRNEHRLDLYTGNRFSVGFSHDFTQLQQVIRTNPRILIVDGIIEKTSQIDHWLQESLKRNESVVIFCIGMLPDVIQTLSLNFKLKKLDVIPIIVSLNNETVNTLKDISIICNTRYVTIDRGDVLSTIKYDEFSTIPSIVLTRSDITIENPRNSTNIELHISQLRQKATKGEDMAKQFIEKRIKSMSSQVANLYIASSTPANKLKNLEEIDRTLLMLPQICNYGIIKFDDRLIALLEKELNCKLTMTKKVVLNTEKSYSMLLSTLYFVKSTINTIKNTNFAVLED
jgi:hypothetical protein